MREKNWHISEEGVRKSMGLFGRVFCAGGSDYAAAVIGEYFKYMRYYYDWQGVE